QAEDGIRYRNVTGVQTCALPIFIVGQGQVNRAHQGPRGEQRQQQESGTEEHPGGPLLTTVNGVGQSSTHFLVPRSPARNRRLRSVPSRQEARSGVACTCSPAAGNGSATSHVPFRADCNAGVKMSSLISLEPGTPVR